MGGREDCVWIHLSARALHQNFICQVNPNGILPLAARRGRSIVVKTSKRLLWWVGFWKPIQPLDKNQGLSLVPTVIDMPLPALQYHLLLQVTDQRCNRGGASTDRRT